VQLEPEQEQLFMEMAEATLAAPRNQRQWTVFELAVGEVLSGPEGQHPVIGTDVEQLAYVGLLRLVSVSPATYILPPEAITAYAEMKASQGAPSERVEAEVRRFLDSEAFRAAYPEAYRLWSDAERRLWAADSESELTMIGLRAREAMQAFATEVVARYQPPDPDPDITKTDRRLGAVIAMFLPALGEKRAAHLKALGTYSVATAALAQRLTHAGQKEGEPVTREDARSVVFHVAVVMFEFARALDAARSSADG
jgi:hypothetical protein